MNEYGIINKNTLENDVVYGYNFANACERNGLNPAEWTILWLEYVD